MIEVTHFTDPGCPWAYSAWPALTTLRWRYGDGLRWTLVTIGLAEEAAQYVERGYTPKRSAIGYTTFRRFGMPFAVMPKPRMSATSPACRAIVATDDGGRLEAGGFQPIEAYDVIVANLDPTLARRPRPEDPVEVLETFSYALTTAEVAAVMAEHLQSPDRDKTERALIGAVTDRRASHHPIGDGALWSATPG